MVPQSNRSRNPRSVLSYVPAFSLVCLILSRTVFAHTRLQDGVLGFGIGTLLAYVIADLAARIFPGGPGPRETEDSDLHTLRLEP